jgi:hypothetical protein
MRYLLLLTFPPGAGPQDGTPEHDAEMADWGRFNEEIRAAGVCVGASGLQIDATTTLRTRDGEPVITDGPYAEAKELLFSFYVLDVEDLDAATAWAAKMPVAEYGSIEIRPMIHDEWR